MEPRNIKSLAAGLAAIALLSACSGTRSYAVDEITSQDKYMSCTNLQLEMTEAKFMREKAERNKSFGLDAIFSPLSYPSTLISANKAESAADNRIAYLQKLYALKNCNNQQYADAAPAPARASNYQPAHYEENYAAPEYHY